VTTASRPRAARARRAVRPSGDDREQAILETAKRLLDERSFADISVDDLAKGAGISRPTFYFYFPSKDAVLVALVAQVITAADHTFQSLPETPPDDFHEACRAGINVFFETFANHEGVIRAGHSVRSSNAEIQKLLSTYMQRWIDSTAATIETQRARGAAPTTLPSVELATALNLMNERALFASFADERPAIPTEHLLDTLVHIWVASIYGESR
jgi:TetR/AcrR family transcriptional regulator, ethionamide resistance regulator